MGAERLRAHFGGLLLLGGRTADLLGRRRAFTVGVLFFTVASLLCGLAWSPAALLAARVVQGVGAAIMTPTALSIISTTFPEGAERNRALGIRGALGGVGATAAWLIGGPHEHLRRVPPSRPSNTLVSRARARHLGNQGARTSAFHGAMRRRDEEP